MSSQNGTQQCAGPWCRNTIEQPATGRPRRFCSTACRQADYRDRQMRRCGQPVVYFTAAGQHEARCELTAREHKADPERPCEARVTVTASRQLGIV